MKRSSGNSIKRASVAICAIVAIVDIVLVLYAAKQIHAQALPQEHQHLWQKAACYMSRRIWVPGKIVEHHKTFNRRGKLEEETKVVTQLSPLDQDQIGVTLLAAEENGKDIAEKLRAAIDGSMTLETLTGDNPFTPKKAQRVTPRYNRQQRQIGNHTCMGFTFIFETGGQSVEGIAWLDKETGLPVEIHSRLTSVPIMEDDVRIAAYHETQYFRLTEQGECMILLSQIQMDIEVPDLWFQGRVTIRSECSGHWLFGSGA